MLVTSQQILGFDSQLGGGIWESNGLETPPEVDDDIPDKSITRRNVEKWTVVSVWSNLAL